MYTVYFSSYIIFDIHKIETEMLLALKHLAQEDRRPISILYVIVVIKLVS